MRAGAWDLHPVWVPGCKCPVQSLNPLHCSSWKDEIVIIARLITYFCKFILRQNYQNTKNRLWDFHFHVFRFCLLCNILVTWSPKTTKNQVTKWNEKLIRKNHLLCTKNRRYMLPSYLVASDFPWFCCFALEAEALKALLCSCWSAWALIKIVNLEMCSCVRRHSV